MISYVTPDCMNYIIKTSLRWSKAKTLWFFEYFSACKYEINKWYYQFVKRLSKLEAAWFWKDSSYSWSSSLWHFMNPFLTFQLITSLVYKTHSLNYVCMYSFALVFKLTASLMSDSVKYLSPQHMIIVFTIFILSSNAWQIKKLQVWLVKNHSAEK